MEEIIKFLGGATLLLAAVAWLIQQLAKHFLNKDIETHRMLLDNKRINYKEKIDLYKGISEPIIELIVTIERQENVTKELMSSFEKKRLMIAAQLAMFAPNYVFDSYNDLIDYLYNAFEGKEEYSFRKFRKIAMKFLTDIRKDIGIYRDEVIYNGNR